ncbi:helix-turn-helix transcriptional regulator [Myroides odoratimimus]|uniref:helix-turn-helix domain-containing protein n=1 Tax=Myroides odoratimimus TaxID=76832 RepID=UPI0031012F67
MVEIKKYEISQFDFDLINHIRRLRENRGMSQQDLSRKMGVSNSFVGNVESITQRHKYSTRHISLLAKAFEFENISDLMDFKTPKYDRILVVYEVETVKEKSKVMSYRIIRIEEIK